ncbi:MAG: DUF2203 domain-containing protein [Egibacteraceae bacterium]|jgi:hypothetical protein
MVKRFTVSEARSLAPAMQRQAQRLAALRADLAEAHLAQQRGHAAAVGGIAEVKAVEARLQESIDWFTQQGIGLKGIAPVIADLPSELDGQPVLLCWLEGERSLDFYHPPETGFMGRRRLPESD